MRSVGARGELASARPLGPARAARPARRVPPLPPFNSTPPASSFLLLAYRCPSPPAATARRASLRERRGGGELEHAAHMQTNNAVGDRVLPRRSGKHQSELNSHDEFTVRCVRIQLMKQFRTVVYTVIYVGFEYSMCF